MRAFLDKYSTTIAWIVTWVVIGGTAVYAYTISEANRKSVCTLRGDLQRRVNAGENFLKENPKGAFGLTPATIRKSIVDQKRTIAALSNVSCSKGEEMPLTDEENKNK